jgi:hypothetical protein
VELQIKLDTVADLEAWSMLGDEEEQPMQTTEAERRTSGRTSGRFSEADGAGIDSLQRPCSGNGGRGRGRGCLGREQRQRQRQTARDGRRPERRRAAARDAEPGEANGAGIDSLQRTSRSSGRRSGRAGLVPDPRRKKIRGDVSRGGPHEELAGGEGEAAAAAEHGGRRPRRAAAAAARRGANLALIPC